MSNGYAQVWDKAAKKLKLVHRLAWEQENGEIPKGFEIHHVCKTRNCFEVSHLQAVTHAENQRLDRPTHCKRGHEFTEANTLYYKTRRRCRTCHNLNQKKHYVQKPNLRANTHCRNGHELSGDNLILPRRCRKCLRAWQQKRKATH